jgi:uncharacterized protein (TIGR03435 family)
MSRDHRFLCALAVAAASLAAQATDGQPAFEVASVKPGKPLGPLGMRWIANGGPGTNDPGLYSCQNCALMMLITRAYGLNADHPSSAPGWMEDQRFDVAAKMLPATTQEQFALMLRNLLAERFKLEVHHEKREVPVYEVVVAKNGPKLRESAPRAAPKEEAAAPDLSQPFKKDKDGYPVIPPGSDTVIAFGPGHARLRLDNESTAKFAEFIAGRLQLPVIDATGLKGKYDFMLSWVPAQPGGSATDDDSGPTLEGAIQSQLGLRLESKKAMVDFLLIDHAEKALQGIDVGQAIRVLCVRSRLPAAGFKAGPFKIQANDAG